MHRLCGRSRSALVCASYQQPLRFLLVSSKQCAKDVGMEDEEGRMLHDVWERSKTLSGGPALFCRDLGSSDISTRSLFCLFLSLYDIYRHQGSIKLQNIPRENPHAPPPCRRRLQQQPFCGGLSLASVNSRLQQRVSCWDAVEQGIRLSCKRDPGRWGRDGRKFATSRWPYKFSRLLGYSGLLLTCSL